MIVMTYQVIQFPPVLVEKGIFYSEYDSNGSHGLKYDPQSVNLATEAAIVYFSAICMGYVFVVT